MSGISQDLLDYIANFKFPYVNDVSSYEKLLKIGQGTFGEVFKARCRRSGKLVALKKILMDNEKEGFPITALREIKMLQKLKHANITDLIDICSERNSKQRFSFYLVFSFCDHDLAGLLSHQALKLRIVDIKTMIKHILMGLFKIHSSNILHRDMKAANVLIGSDGVLKLADFGLARPMFKDSSTACYTNRVVTLWYRPPELLLGARNYGPAIDIWGAGCIMAELWTRTPILQGDSEQNQLILISNLCGSINTTTWTDVDKLPYFNKMELPQNLPRRLRDKIRGFLHNNDEALQVLDIMLTLNPAKRPSAEALLDHSFFFHSPRPLDHIRDLLSPLTKNMMNMFEYTAGCGAHANRKMNRGPPPSQQIQQQQSSAHSSSSATQLPVAPATQVPPNSIPLNAASGSSLLPQPPLPPYNNSNRMSQQQSQPLKSSGPPQPLMSGGRMSHGSGGGGMPTNHRMGAAVPPPYMPTSRNNQQPPPHRVHPYARSSQGAPYHHNQHHNHHNNNSHHSYGGGGRGDQQGGGCGQQR